MTTATMRPLKRSEELDAAWLTVEPVLASKKRGDELTRDEVQRAAGGVAVARLADRVRRYYLRHGIDLMPVPGRGWRLPTDEEQVRNRAAHHARKAKRSNARELLAASTANDAELTPEARRLRDLHVRSASTRAVAYRESSTERRAILGAPPARPQLKAGASRD